MHSAKKTLAFLLFVGLSLNLGAVEIDVGNRVVYIPFPDGFVELTPDMPPYYETMKAYVGPENARYLTLIPADKAEALLRGEDIDLYRHIRVESLKNVSKSSVSLAIFNELRSALREQIGDVSADIDKHTEMIDKGNVTVSDKFDAEIAVDLGGIVVLPIHLDTANAIANSMFATVSAAVNGDSPSTDVLAITTVFLHVKDKVLFLYVNGTESDLDWTREFAASWAAAIVAANPLSVEETRAVQRSDGINWDQVLDKAVIGGLIGGAIAFLGGLFRRRKKE